MISMNSKIYVSGGGVDNNTLNLATESENWYSEYKKDHMYLDIHDSGRAHDGCVIEIGVTNGDFNKMRSLSHVTLNTDKEIKQLITALESCLEMRKYDDEM